MVTHFAGGLRARPLEARPDREAGVIWFLSNVRGLKDDEVQTDSNICLTFVYPKEKVYLSITAAASWARDPKRAKTLWNAEQQYGGPTGLTIQTYS